MIKISMFTEQKDNKKKLLEYLHRLNQEILIVEYVHDLWVYLLVERVL